MYILGDAFAMAPLSTISSRQCRICLEPILSPHEAVSPCQCKGSCKYIHVNCLQRYLVYKRKWQCDICLSDISFTPIFVKPFIAVTSIVIFLISYCSWLVLHYFAWMLFQQSPRADTFSFYLHMKFTNVAFIITDIWCVSLFLIHISGNRNTNYLIKHLSRGFLLLPLFAIRCLYKNTCRRFDRRVFRNIQSRSRDLCVVKM